jgi:hypothetical protein
MQQVWEPEWYLQGPLVGVRFLRPCPGSPCALSLGVALSCQFKLHAVIESLATNLTSSYTASVLSSGLTDTSTLSSCGCVRNIMEDSSNDDFAEEGETEIEMQGLISGVADSRQKELVDHDPSPPPDGGRKARAAGKYCILPILGMLKHSNIV